MEERLAMYSQPDPQSDCILWTGPMSGEYGWAGTDRAHVVVYERERGPVPKGFELHHRCKTKRCINLDHLEPITRAEHNKREPRRWVGQTTHCKQGHEFTPENTYIMPQGRRQCRACHVAWQRAYRQRKLESTLPL